MGLSDSILGRIGWGSYGGFEGPWFKGQLGYEMPSDPSFDDKLMSVITASEGGHFDAINMYDRCKLTVGIIQWGEACTNHAVAAMVGMALERAPTDVKAVLAEAGLELVKTPSGYRFSRSGATDMNVAFFGGGSGLVGQWTSEQKAVAKRVAAVAAAVWQVPGAKGAQLEFTTPKLLDFARQFGSKPKALFEGDFPKDSWEGAMRAGYISFAANLPAYAARRLRDDLASMTPKDRCIELLRRLTFEPGVAIYPHRYEMIRPVLEKLFEIDLPDHSEELSRFKAGFGELLERFPNVASWQTELIDEGFDLGPDGADGRPGPMTTAAVRGFQSKHGLDVDGAVGKNTLTALVKEQDARLSRLATGG